MKPTQINLYLFPVDSDEDGNLRGYARVELDHQFVIQDIRIIRVSCTNHQFIAFPSRRRGVRCCNPDCHVKRDPGDRYCSSCGTRQPPVNKEEIRFTNHRDCCFPKTAFVRSEIEGAILRAHALAVSQTGLNSFLEVGSGAQVYVSRNLHKDLQHDGERDFRSAGRTVSG